MNDLVFVTLLVQFGFSNKEAETYHHLLKHGPKSVVALSRNLHTYREQAYRTLLALQARDAVELKLDEHGVYMAVPLERMLDTELRRHQLDYKDKKELQQKILEAKKSVHPEPLGTSCRFQLHNARNEILSYCLRMIDSSVHSVFFIIPLELLYSMAHTLQAAVINAAIRGAEVRGITDPIGYPDSPAKNLKIRKNDGYNGICFLSVDSIETVTLICWAKLGGLQYKEVSAFYCDNPTYAKHLEFVFDMVWNQLTDTKTAKNSKLSEMQRLPMDNSFL